MWHSVSINKLIKFVFVKQDFVEAYNLKKDKFQMVNLGYIMKKSRSLKFRSQLSQMIQCKNEECLVDSNT